MLKRSTVMFVVVTAKLLQSSSANFTHGLAGREIKTKVESNLEAPHTTRYYNTIWNYKLCQLTTSNLKRMKETGIDSSGFFNRYDGNNKSNSTSNESDNDSDNSLSPVCSNLQPHAIHQFVKDNAYSLIICVPKNSQHYRNVLECNKVSVMIGHTDPQLFHWFKQLGTLPPRAIISGHAELLSGPELAEVWDTTLVRHSVLHSMAEDMWNSSDSKTESEQAYIEKRHKEEEAKRMHRLSSSDWRTKFKDRERNPTRDEDAEMPIYVLKPETFAVMRLKPEVRLWINVSGQTLRVWDPIIPPQDPLGKAAMRFIKMLNVSRNKLIPSLNINYALKLVNAFVYDVDQGGFWAVGTEERNAEDHHGVTESWREYRLEFGKGQIIKTEQEVEWWIRGLNALGVPEMTSSDTETREARNSPELNGFSET